MNSNNNDDDKSICICEQSNETDTIKCFAQVFKQFLLKRRYSNVTSSSIIDNILKCKLIYDLNIVYIILMDQNKLHNVNQKKLDKDFSTFFMENSLNVTQDIGQILILESFIRRYGETHPRFKLLFQYDQFEPYITFGFLSQNF